MKDIVIVSGKRTPMAEYGGALRDLSALELGALAAKAAIHYGLAAACIGGGQGIAIIVEAI